MAEWNISDDFGVTANASFNQAKSVPSTDIDQKETDVNLIESKNFQFDWVETNPPEPDTGVDQYNNDTQSTPPMARGVVKNSIVYKTNLKTDHACHLYAGFGIDSLTSGLGLNTLFELPPSRIQASIQLRINFSGIVSKLREAINAVLEAMGLDLTGEFSFWYSEAKKLVRWIKRKTQWIRQLVSDINALIEFMNQLVEVIMYLISLPAKLLAMVSECIFGFLGSIAALPSQLAAIPGAVVGGTISQSLNAISNLATTAQTDITNKSASATTEKNGLTVNNVTPDAVNSVIASTPQTPAGQSSQGNKP